MYFFLYRGFEVTSRGRTFLPIGLDACKAVTMFRNIKNMRYFRQFPIYKKQSTEHVSNFFHSTAQTHGAHRVTSLDYRAAAQESANEVFPDLPADGRQIFRSICFVSLSSAKGFCRNMASLLDI